MEAGASTKVVDCILELKALHDWKQMNGGNGFNKPPRTPFTIHSVGKMHSQVSEETSLDRAHRRLEMTASCNIETPAESETHNLEGILFPLASLSVYLRSYRVHVTQFLSPNDYLDVILSSTV